MKPEQSKEPEQPQDLSAAIKGVSAAMTKLLKSGLNRRAIITLLADDTKIGKSTIARVLESSEELAAKYTQKDKKG